MPLGTPSKNPETKRKIRPDSAPRKVQPEPGPDSTVSWVVAFAAFMINFIMAGLSRMSGILYVAFIEMFKIDRKGASMPFSVRSSTMNLLGPVVGVLGQKYGVRKVSVIGGILGTVSAAACFYADEITWITMIWGGLNGAGTALVTTLTTVVIAQYFDKYKTTASGLSFSGACIGSFIFPPLMEVLLDMYGLGGSFLIVAGIIMHVIPAAMILRKPIWIKKAIKIRNLDSTKVGNVGRNTSNSTSETKNVTNGVDLNFLRTNRELVVSLLTTDISAGEENKSVVYPPRDDIVNEMEDLYTFVGKTPVSLRLSEAPSKVKKKLESETSKENGERDHDPNRLSVSGLHTPVRKCRSSSVEDPLTPQCKPFIVSKLNELYNKSEKQIMDSVNDKNRYTKVLKELRMLHKLYEVVKKKNIFSPNSPFRKSKVAPKVLIPQSKTTSESNGIWCNIGNSVKLHGNPLFLLISLCRAVHFSTFIPVVTIIVDYTMDKGLTEEDGIYVIAALSVGDLLGRLCLGWITDRGFISLPKYMLLVMIIQGICTASLPMMNSKLTLLPMICMYALLQGSVFVRHSVLISKYMKPNEQSIAQGCVNFFAGLLGFAVPSYIGYFRDSIGSYDGVFYLNGAVGAITGLLWIFEPIFVKLTTDLSREVTRHPVLKL